MDVTDPDYAAFVERLPVLRRYELVIRSRLHPLAIRDPGSHGGTLHDLALYFQNGVNNNVSRVNRAFLKRMAAFADHVMHGTPPEKAVRLAVSEYPDPKS